MHIIIIANHQSSDLAPLTNLTSTAMLELAGKPLIEHLLENVANIPHSKLTIVASRAVSGLRKYIETGARWGLEIEFLLSRPNENLNSLKRRHPATFNGNLLILSANRVYTTNLAELDSVQQLATNSVTAKTVNITKPSAIIDNHTQYLNVSLAAVRGEIPQIKLRGSERVTGLRSGYQSQISPLSVQLGRTHAGNHCQVDKSASLKGTVVLESSVVIDRNTEIEDSIVLAHTYIGEQLSLKRCIVSGRHIIRVDEGVVLELADSFMAAPLKKGMYVAHLANPTNQLAGIVVGIAALPLMLLGVVVSFWENPYQPFVKQTWVSNLPPKSGARYRTYETFEFNVSNVALRKLPQVLDVSLGHLRWFGVSVASEAELDAREEPWQMTRDKHPMGMLGIAQIYFDENTDPTRRFMKDATYVSTASFRTNLEILKRGIRRLCNFDVNRANRVQRA